MKLFNKQILEAINRGILFALDDFDNIQNFPKKELVKPNNKIKDYLDGYKKFVDLGLPSGNLWCKFNLDAPVMRMKNPEYGDRADYIGAFYAWGETKEKQGSEFKKDTYKYYDKETEKFFYNGNKLTLLDDPAYTNNPFLFEIYTPSALDFQELVDNTTQEYTEKYNNIEGLSGVIYKSKTNDNEIFLPSIMFKGSSENKYVATVWDGNKCGYWTCDVADIDRYNDTSYMFIHKKEHVYSLLYWVSVSNMPQLRWYGAQIRPIIKKGV